MKKYLIEFIGTFFLVLTICFTNGDYLAPIAVGFMLAGVIYMGYGISGAHYNPVTTLSMLLLKRINAKDASVYVLIQFLAAMAAAGFYILVWGRNIGIPRPTFEINILKPVAMELLFTFVMMLVILFTAAWKRTEGNNYYGIAIGAIVFVAGATAGPISGAALNPAVGFGPAIIDSLFGSCDCNPYEYAWIYLAGPIPAAVAATFTFKYLTSENPAL